MWVVDNSALAGVSLLYLVSMSVPYCCDGQGCACVRLPVALSQSTLYEYLVYLYRSINSIWLVCALA